MTARVVNLRRARKAKERAGAATQAAENRLRFGMRKAMRALEAATQALDQRRLDAHQRESRIDPDNPDGE